NRIDLQCLGNRYDKQTLADLGNAEIRCIENRIGGAITDLIERGANLLRHIVTAEIQDVRHVFDDDSKRLRIAHIVEKPPVKNSTRVCLKRVFLTSYST